MKKSLHELGKKKLLIASFAVILAVGGVTAAIAKPDSGSADTSPLTTEVDRQGDELANHEARIANAENDIKDLQTNTGTAPSSDRVSVPSVSSTTATTTSTPPAQQTPSPTPPAPVTVTKSTYGFNVSGEHFCSLVYSDGSTARVNASVTVVQQGNSTSTQNNCQDFLGHTKS